MRKAGKGRAAPPSRHGISDQLRDVIDSRGLSGYAVGKLCDVSPGVVARFMSGQRGLTLETLDRLGRGLGLRLVEVATRRRPVRPGPPPGAALEVSGPGPEIETNMGLEEEHGA